MNSRNSNFNCYSLHKSFSNIHCKASTMNFTDNIIDLTARKEHQEKSHAQETSLSPSGSNSLPTSWHRDNLNRKLAKLLNLHPLSSALMHYYTSLSMAEISHILGFYSSLGNVRAHSINSPVLKEALLFLDAQRKTTLDVKFSQMMLHHAFSFSQSQMTNILLMPFSTCQVIGDHQKITRNSRYTFPHRLHEIISNPDYGDYIIWLPNGCAWKIVERKNFETVVIPRHFRHERFTSFMRQVRMIPIFLDLQSILLEISNSFALFW
jgi:hypothetical protein